MTENEAPTPEIQVLQGVLRGTPLIPDAPTGKVNGTRLAALASFHKLLPECYAFCRQVPHQIDQLDSLRTMCLAALESTKSVVDASLPALRAVAAEHDLLVCKGLYFLVLGRSERTMADADIYVRPGDRDRALALLSAAGFVARESASRIEKYLENRGQLALYNHHANIDFHWWLNNSPLTELVCDLTIEKILEDARTVSWRGVTLKVPSPEDACLLNAIHMAFEHWGEVARFFMDHRVLLQAANPVRLLKRARSVGLERVLYHSVRVTEAHCDFAASIDIPPTPAALVFANTATALWSDENRTTRLLVACTQHRRSLGRFLLHSLEVTRIVDLADETRRRPLIRILMAPGPRLLGRLFPMQPRTRSRLWHKVGLVFVCGLSAVLHFRRALTRNVPTHQRARVASNRSVKAASWKRTAN